MSYFLEESNDFADRRKFFEKKLESSSFLDPIGTEKSVNKTSTFWSPIETKRLVNEASFLQLNTNENSLNQNNETSYNFTMNLNNNLSNNKRKADESVIDEKSIKKIKNNINTIENLDKAISSLTRIKELQLKISKQESIIENLRSL
jgi:hypothetical protein